VNLKKIRRGRNVVKMVSGGMTCIKYLLFVFNLLFSITGLAILVIGAIIQDFYSGYSDFLHGKFFVGPVLLITVGVTIFIVAFFGCCGAIKENHCMIMTFAACLLVIFGMELGGGITAYLLRDDVADVLQSSFNTTMQQYKTNKEVAKTWDIMQHDLRCCGINGPDDWEEIFKDNVLPETCCANTNPCYNNEEAHKNGCLQLLQNEVENYALIIGGVAIGVACIQLVGMIFACCLGKSIRKEYETV
ncbi:hypothetical protein L9F63_021525, partial [Diploptera punctata]